MREISRLNDYFVRYLFGYEGNEDILLDFINSVMYDSNFGIFTKVEVQNPFNLKNNIDSKESILDIKATAENGKIIIIEIQSIGNETFIWRTLYYWAKNYSSVLEKGMDYGDLFPVVSINILNFSLDDEDLRPHTCYMIQEKDNNKLLTDHFELHFIETPKYNRNNLSEPLSVWLDFFTFSNLEENMEVLVKKKPIMEKVLNRYKHFVSNKDYITEYDRRETYRLGYNMTIKREREKGIEEGMEKGKIEGKTEGKIEGKIETAIKMLERKIPIEDIIDMTGLSKEDIEKLY